MPQQTIAGVAAGLNTRVWMLRLRSRRDSWERGDFGLPKSLCTSSRPAHCHALLVDPSMHSRRCELENLRLMDFATSAEFTGSFGRRCRRKDGARRVGRRRDAAPSVHGRLLVLRPPPRGRALCLGWIVRRRGTVSAGLLQTLSFTSMTTNASAL